MNSTSPAPDTTRRAHRLIPMTGRDPHEGHRAATPLELLFDLTFVVAFGAAGNEMAHVLAEGYVAEAIIAFSFAMFAICWAWINYSWFASAYDTDDWGFRLLTMLQMVGVIVLALGLPELFESIKAGETVDNAVLVGGYIVMRVAMVGHWLRAYRQDPSRADTARVYIITIVVAQVGWVVVLLMDTTVTETFLLASIPLLIEVAGPVIAEQKYSGTPWHAHHISERYGLLAIITLGEGVIGTVAAASALVHNEAIGWSTEAIVLVSAGTLLTFGMWWTYFTIPWGDVLHHHRERSFFWGYGHILIFGSIAAMGAGLHLAQYFLEDHSELGVLGVTLSVAIPVLLFAVLLLLMYDVAMRTADAFHILLSAGVGAVIALALILAATGSSIAVTLAVVALAPVVIVVGFETIGHRHMDEHIERLSAPRAPNS